MTIQRRHHIDQLTEPEKAIYDAMQSVEDAGAHPHLTKAVTLLGQAKEAVGDFVDGYQPMEDGDGGNPPSVENTMDHVQLNNNEHRSWLCELVGEDGNLTGLALTFDHVTGCAGFTDVAFTECMRFSREIDANSMIKFMNRISIVPKKMKGTEHEWFD